MNNQLQDSHADIQAESGDGPVKVRLTQINQAVGKNYYLPYAIGMLQAYAQAHLSEPGRFVFLPPLYKRMLREEALAALAGVDIAGFSVYVWSIRRSLMIAQAHKQARPGALIVFGGPHVPDRAEEFLREHTFIDVVSHGAGEEVFTQLLEAYPSRDWAGIPGISWIDAEGAFHHHPPAERKRDLSDYPSPFLAGVFDPLLAEYPHWYAPYETNRGCPFSCTFCDWGSNIASKLGRFPEERIYADFDWIARHKIGSIYCCDANFGILPRDIEIAREAARVRAKYGYPQAFQIQGAKNVSARVVEIQKVLTDAGLSATAAISVQTFDAETLKSIRRENISLAAFQKIHRDCLAQGIFTYTDIIMNLPGETLASFILGLDILIASGQYNKVLFHDTIMLPNAEISQPEYRAKFGFESVMVTIPGNAALADGVPELMEVVIATKDISRADWVTMHVYAWTLNLLFYTHKMMQLVLLVMQHQLGCEMHELVQCFTDGDLSAWPALQFVQQSLTQAARHQQKGYPYNTEGANFVLTPVDGIYLMPDLTMQVQLGGEGLIDPFFRQAGERLLAFALTRQPDFPVRLLQEALMLNRSYFLRAFGAHQFPLKDVVLTPEKIPLHFNVPEFYQALLAGQPIPLGPREPVLVTI